MQPLVFSFDSGMRTRHAEPLLPAVLPRECTQVGKDMSTAEREIKALQRPESQRLFNAEIKQKHKEEEGHVKKTNLYEVGLVLIPISTNLSRAQHCSPACLGSMCQRKSSCRLSTSSGENSQTQSVDRSLASPRPLHKPVITW